eukprot:TRINITY_DN7259_c0_g1_i1.p1 TRINITY_DN7259_c0_g1~~TRINITY_DN7259_c0_g1_i1.p1  ORF type:complete len:697 (-),score=93.16 TRINITY_DN7259_c0_g1_i1:12-2102(-)
MEEDENNYLFCTSCLNRKHVDNFTFFQRLQDSHLCIDCEEGQTSQFISCKECQKTLPLESFSNRQRKNKLESTCKSCCQLKCAPPSEILTCVLCEEDKDKSDYSKKQYKSRPISICKLCSDESTFSSIVCIICGDEKDTTSFSKNQRKRRPNSICKPCNEGVLAPEFADQTIICNECGKLKTVDSFSKKQLKKENSECMKCIESKSEMPTIRCIDCQIEKGADKFSKTQRKNKPESVCKKCNIKNYMPQEIVCIYCKKPKTLANYSKMEKKNKPNSICKGCKKMSSFVPGPVSNFVSKNTLYCKCCQELKFSDEFPKDATVSAGQSVCSICESKNTDSLFCSQCCLVKSVKEFSNTQRKKKPNSLCKMCVFKNTSNLDEEVSCCPKCGKYSLLSTDCECSKKPEELACCECHNTLPLDQFSNNQQKKGINATCKMCVEEKINWIDNGLPLEFCIQCENRKPGTEKYFYAKELKKEVKVCNVCRRSNTSLTCVECGVDRVSFRHFDMEELKKRPNSRCKICTLGTTLKCIKCGIERLVDCFSLSQKLKTPNSKCKFCISGHFYHCSACMKDLPPSSFSSLESSDDTNRILSCDECERTNAGSVVLDHSEKERILQKIEETRKIFDLEVVSCSLCLERKSVRDFEPWIVVLEHPCCSECLRDEMKRDFFDISFSKENELSESSDSIFIESDIDSWSED